MDRVAELEQDNMIIIGKINLMIAVQHSKTYKQKHGKKITTVRDNWSVPIQPQRLQGQSNASFSLLSSRKIISLKKKQTGRKYLV